MSTFMKKLAMGLAGCCAVMGLSSCYFDSNYCYEEYIGQECDTVCSNVCDQVEKCVDDCSPQEECHVESYTDGWGNYIEDTICEDVMVCEQNCYYVDANCREECYDTNCRDAYRCADAPECWSDEDCDSKYGYGMGRCVSNMCRLNTWSNGDAVSDAENSDDSENMSKIEIDDTAADDADNANTEL